MTRAPRRAGRGAASFALGLALLALPLPGGGEPAATAAPALQPLVDATPEGGVLRPPAGTYAGPVVVSRPLVLEGGGGVTVDGGGRGTVLTVATNGVTLRGLRIVHSGSNHDGVDAGVKIAGSANLLEDNAIEDCLFGIDLAQSNDNVVRRNRIHSKAVEMGFRGDAIRLWYSFRNQIVDNEISDTRDVVVWYSADNVISRNRVTRSRYALHTMYAATNLVEGNEFRGNMTGIFLMYSDGVVVRRNRIVGAQGAAGVGVGFKETSSVVLEGNDIVYCATGIYIDVSPYEPDTENRFERNRLAYNGVGVNFHTDWQGNVFRDNEFRGNFTQVAVRGGGGATRNVWERNWWDDYQGFDRDGDGTGDTSYELRAYADRLWMAIPPLAFFRASPVLEVIDFLERLAPFSAPTLILQDTAPRFERPSREAS
jgi:nitrous oxidase accessory protein